MLIEVGPMKNFGPNGIKDMNTNKETTFALLSKPTFDQIDNERKNFNFMSFEDIDIINWYKARSWDHNEYWDERHRRNGHK